MLALVLGLIRSFDTHQSLLVELEIDPIPSAFHLSRVEFLSVQDISTISWDVLGVKVDYLFSLHGCEALL